MDPLYLLGQLGRELTNEANTVKSQNQLGTDCFSRNAARNGVESFSDFSESRCARLGAPDWQMNRGSK